MIPPLLLLSLVLAFPALAADSSASADNPADEQALRDYQLSVGKVEKLCRVGERMREYVKTHPEEKHSDIMKGKTLDDSVKAIEARPEVMAMLKAAGVTPREFMLGTLTMMQATMMVSMRAQYPEAKTPDNINPNNVELVQRHPELSRKWAAAWEIGMHRRPGQRPSAADGGQESGH
jgi:hypothetical protein